MEESQGETTEGDPSDSEDDDPKDGKNAIGGTRGEVSSDVQGKGISGVDWGVISTGEGSESSERSGFLKKWRGACANIGRGSLVRGFAGEGRDSVKSRGSRPDSSNNRRPNGGGGLGFEDGVKIGVSQGLSRRESVVTFQQSHSKQVTKVGDGFCVNPKPGGAIGRGLIDCVSLFVGNIPPSFSVKRLQLIFMEFGEVIDVFIPQKSSKLFNSKFAFVRYKTMEEANCAIQGMDGVAIEGRIVVVNVARFSRIGSLNQPRYECVPSCAEKTESCSELCKSYSNSPGALSYAKVVQKADVYSGDPSSVRKKVCVPSGNLEWLSASIVGTLRAGYDFNNVKSILKGYSEEVVGVSLLGGCRCLLTFSSVLSRNKAMNNSAWSKWFFSMEPWKAESVEGPYRMWIYCVGIPVTAWNAESFDLIGKQWGRLIEVDEDSGNRSQWVVACLLIESKFCAINECIELEVDGLSYIVQVSSSVQDGLIDAQRDVNLKEGGVGSHIDDKRWVKLVGNPNAYEHAVQSGNMTVGSPKESGNIPINAENTSYGYGCSEYHCSVGDEVSSNDKFNPVLFGFFEEKAIRILDEDAGCLIRIMGSEDECRYVLGESEIRGGSLAAGGHEEAQKLPPEVSHLLPHKFKDEWPYFKPSERDISGCSVSELNTTWEELANDQPKITNGESGIVDSMAGQVKSAILADEQDQVGVKTEVACGGSEKISLASVQKFVASQEFINSSINLTTDVLVECKEHGIRISESDQRAIIEAMTKRHIQAEVDFYAESSSGGEIGAM